jgi:replicative DNA helicase
MLSDIGTERAVLAGICKHGYTAYLDTSQLLKVSTFTVEINQIIFKCIEECLNKNDINKIDLPTILSAASNLGLSYIFEKPAEFDHLRAVLNFPLIELDNLKNLAKKIGKLEVARTIIDQLELAKVKLLSVTGDELISDILEIAENSIFDLTNKLQVKEDIDIIGEGLDEYLINLIENPIDKIGISTGFPKYDDIIGGGLRGGTINVIAARMKQGKSILVNNIANFITSKLDIPVLYIDTELKKEDQINRSLASISGVPIKDIETGKIFGSTLDKVKEAKEQLKKIPHRYHHKSIIGMNFETQLSLMRRWLVRHVGLDEEGKAFPCVIIYDYIKLMSGDEIKAHMQEYQALGYMMSSLHNFAVRYDIPIIATAQLNRDGIDKESTAAVSGSDRILWLCSNFSIFKDKSDEEIARDGDNAGNKKMIVLAARHGPGNQWKEYINYQMLGKCARITENMTNYELEKEKGKKESGFEYIENIDDILF